MDNLEDILRDLSLDFPSENTATALLARLSQEQPSLVTAAPESSRESPNNPELPQEEVFIEDPITPQEQLIIGPEFSNDSIADTTTTTATLSRETPSTSENPDTTNVPENLNSQIPLNSPTLLLDNSTSRFSGAEWYNEIQKSKIIIGGMGGISSHMVFNLARMAPATIAMYDDDVVETANMSGQLYSHDDVGMAKVNAIESMLRKYTTMGNIYAIQEKFTDSSEAGDIMMCGFDNMEARKLFFHKWKDHVLNLPKEQRSKCLFLDGRLSLTVMQILCITGDDSYNISRYEEQFLFSDAEAEATVCSMKQTTYLASMIGATMVNLFTNFVANTLEPPIPYTLSFFTEYDAQFMIFKTEN